MLIDYGTCDNNPCGNGGTCVDGVGFFTCTCAAGFTGATCDVGKIIGFHSLSTCCMCA